MWRAWSLAIALVLLSDGAADAQESLTVVLLPAAVAFVLENGDSTNPGAVPLVAVTTWTLSLTRTQVSLYAYFSSASSALSHTLPSNTTDIPASRVEVSINGGARVSFSETTPFGAANAGRQIFAQSITLANRIGTRSDTLSLNINLAGLSIPADIYTGSLRLRARASP
jgi:hypothetical protein